VGNLQTSRDFTYVDDTTHAMVNALETENIEGDIINIGTGQTHEMKAILSLIQKETGTEDKPAQLDKARLRPRDVQTLVTDNIKAKKILGWAPTTPFTEGIRKTIQWYIDNGQTWGYEQHGWKWRY
jgi:dTDP-glucose 4,6-dehydratase